MHCEVTTAIQGNVTTTPDDTVMPKGEPLRQCRVLVVDDDDLIRAQLMALLRLADYDVHEAASGQEALRILDTTSCQIILTDWQMADMDGLSLCRNVRLKDDASVWRALENLLDRLAIVNGQHVT